MTEKEFVNKIEQALDEHHITQDNECGINCFCWSVEDILLEMKGEQ